MKNINARLCRLERQTTADDAFPKSYVLWDDESYPEDIRPQDLVVRLVHKAPSAEAWVADVRRRQAAGSEGEAL